MTSLFSVRNCYPMKLSVFAFLFLFAVSNLAFGALEGPIDLYFPESDTIFLVQVTSFNRQQVNFTVTETLRGKPVKSLSLVPGIIDLKQGGEFLILSSKATRYGQWGNHIGSLMKGNLGWLDAPVMRDGSEIYVYCPAWKDGHVIGDKVLNGLGYLTLNHIKRQLNENPAEPSLEK